MYHNSSGHNDEWRSYGPQNRVIWFDQGYRNGEMVEMGKNLTRVKKKGTAYWDYIIADNNRKHFLDVVFVPANTEVKLRSVAMINGTEYDGTTITSGGANDRPRLIARPVKGNTWYGGRATHIDGRSVFTGENVWNYDEFNDDLFRTSTNAQNDLLNGFVDHVLHTSACIGAFETKDLTVAAQKESYLLCYGYYFAGNDFKHEGMQAKDIQVMMSTVHPGAGAKTQSIKKVNVRSGTSFDTGRKRISGRI